MKPATSTLLGPEQLKPISSRYLADGRSQDRWQIDWARVEGSELEASVTMREYAVSDTDARGFHLSLFCALEFASQLMIVYAHLWAGLDEKRREGWMVDSSARARQAIRRTAGIRVHMQVRQMRRRGEHLYCVADYRVSDDAGGLFEITLKGFLS